MSINLQNVGSGYNLAVINDNFNKIQKEFNEKVLRRKLDLYDSNVMDTHIDMDTHRIVNIATGVNKQDACTVGQIEGLLGGEKYAIRAEEAALLAEQHADDSANSAAGSNSAYQLARLEVDKCEEETQKCTALAGTAGLFADDAEASAALSKAYNTNYVDIDEMLAGSPDVLVGDTVRTSFAVWKRIADVGDTLDDYVALTPVFAEDFGCVGDWNMITQTGTDNSIKGQAYIDYMASQPSIRLAGKRSLNFGEGAFYFTTKLTLPDTFSFGVQVNGHGIFCTYLLFDKGVPGEAILSEIEFVEFKDITISGDEEVAINSTTSRDILIKGRLASDAADVDVQFTNCHIKNAKVGVQVWGRGCVFNGGFTSGLRSQMQIVASDQTVWNPGHSTQDDSTGMRHYTIRNQRADQTLILIEIVEDGASTSIDYINNIKILGNDLLGTFQMVEGPTATIRRAQICNNTALESFSVAGATTGIVNVKAVYDCLDLGNNYAKRYSYDGFVPGSNAHTLSTLWNADGIVDGLTISSGNFKNLGGRVVDCDSGNNIIITHNAFPGAWDFPQWSNHYVIFANVGAVKNSKILNNTFLNQVGSTGQPFLYNDLVQGTNLIEISGNESTRRFADHRGIFIPTLYANTTVISTGLVTSRMYYEQVGNKLHVEFGLAGDLSSYAGSMVATLPVPAVASMGAITASYAGGGTVNKVDGFTLAGYVMGPLEANSGTQRLVFKISKDLETSALSAGYGGASSLLLGKFEYLI